MNNGPATGSVPAGLADVNAGRCQVDCRRYSPKPSPRPGFSRSTGQQGLGAQDEMIDTEAEVLVVVHAFGQRLHGAHRHRVALDGQGGDGGLLAPQVLLALGPGDLALGARQVAGQGDRGVQGGAGDVGRLLLGEPGVDQHAQAVLGELDPVRAGQHALEGQFGHGRVAAQRLHQASHDRSQLLVPRPRGVRQGDVLEEGVAHGRQQFVLVADVPVQGHRGHAELGGQAPDRQRVRALLVGDREGALDDGGPAQLGAGRCGGGSPSGTMLTTIHRTVFPVRHTFTSYKYAV